MRDVKSSDKNSIAIFDKLSGTGIVLFYRTPSTKERVKYKSEMVMALNSRNFERMYEIQIEWAKKLLTGFSSTSFGYDGKPISSDPSNENYDANWLKMLEESSSDLLMDFSESVMGQTTFIVKAGGVSEDFFTKSSGNTKEPGLTKSEVTT